MHMLANMEKIGICDGELEKVVKERQLLIASNLGNLSLELKHHKALPLILAWGIWLTLNTSIFED